MGVIERRQQCDAGFPYAPERRQPAVARSVAFGGHLSGALIGYVFANVQCPRRARVSTRGAARDRRDDTGVALRLTRQRSPTDLAAITVVDVSLADEDRR